MSILSRLSIRVWNAASSDDDDGGDESKTTLDIKASKETQLLNKSTQQKKKEKSSKRDEERVQDDDSEREEEEEEESVHVKSNKRQRERANESGEKRQRTSDAQAVQDDGEEEDCLHVKNMERSSMSYWYLRAFELLAMHRIDAAKEALRLAYRDGDVDAMYKLAVIHGILRVCFEQLEAQRSNVADLLPAGALRWWLLDNVPRVVRNDNDNDNDDDVAAIRYLRLAVDTQHAQAMAVEARLLLCASKAAEAVGMMQRAAELGCADAQRCMAGVCLARGEATSARRWFSKAAARGDVRAQVRMGAALSGTDDNEEEARQWFAAAASQGWPDGIYRLAMATGDADERMVLLRRAAKLGHGGAHFELGAAARVDGRLGDAYSHFARAALDDDSDERHAATHYELARLYTTGAGVGGSLLPPNTDEAMRHLEAASNGGHMIAKRLLAVHLLNNVPQRCAEALALLRQVVDAAPSIREADKRALYVLGCALARAPGSDDGGGCIDSASVAEGIAMLRIAADAGVCNAQIFLARHYMHAVPPMRVEAMRLFAMAAEKGDAKSMTVIADNWLAQGDTQRGAEMLRRAADAGDPTALFRLAMALRASCSADVDVTRAMASAASSEAATSTSTAQASDWMRMLCMSAKRGHVRAQCALSGIILCRQPLPDHMLATAVSLLRDAARQDDGDALYCLGLLTLAGVGVAPSQQDAHRMFMHAGMLNNGPALNYIGCHMLGGNNNNNAQDESEAHAINFLQRAVDLQCREAAFNRAVVHHRHAQSADAFALFARAADAGSRVAQLYAGVACRDRRRGTDAADSRDLTSAVRYLIAACAPFEPSAAAAPSPANVTASIVAARVLGELCKFGGQATRAVQLYTRAAVAGDATACFRLGKLYARGIEGAAPNVARATRFLRAAISLGNGCPNASFELACLLLALPPVLSDGATVSNSHVVVEKLLTRCANATDFFERDEAAFMLACHYVRRGGASDRVHAWLRVASQHGHVDATRRLALVLRTGQGCKVDAAQANRLDAHADAMAKASGAATAPSPFSPAPPPTFLAIPRHVAFARLAAGNAVNVPLVSEISMLDKLSSSAIVASSPSSATTLKELDALLLSSNAPSALSSSSSSSSSPSSSPSSTSMSAQGAFDKSVELRQSDATRSMVYLRHAASAGHAMAQHQLADTYRRGVGGLVADRDEAMRWYSRAAAQAHAPAIYELGMMHAANKDEPAAIEHLRRAAELSVSAALVALGMRHYMGVPNLLARDDSAALSCFRRAALVDGNPNAQFMLGIAYRDGRGVPQSNENAIAWFQRAADQELPEALFNLAVMSHPRHRALRVDDAGAIELYRRAAQLNHAGAIHVLKNIGDAESQSTQSES
jgi:TPR repeat protein